MSVKKRFMKGNEAIVIGALCAGCSQYYGYPITPSSEIIHTCAQLFPQVGAGFVQAESEVSAINMVYGAAGCGQRVMTASSSPGISLKQEGVSYLAGAELPCVVINIQRAGPGLGNIFPEQGDYNQCVKGGGHGNYKVPVFAPASPQEMCDFTMQAFELAEKYRTPVYVMADAYIGQVMEPVIVPAKVKTTQRQPWAVYADKESAKNLICSIHMSAEELEAVNIKLQKKYQTIEDNEVKFEDFETKDADMVLVAYGITSRIARTAVEVLRSKGMKVGLLRPMTLFPFPKKRLVELADNKAKVFTVLELSNGQMLDDVRLCINGKRPVEFYGRMGGAVPTIEEVVAEVSKLYRKHLA